MGGGVEVSVGKGGVEDGVVVMRYGWMIEIKLFRAFCLMTDRQRDIGDYSLGCENQM